MRELREWVPMGHTLSKSDQRIREQFKGEHPKYHGELRLTPMKDGFTKIEFRGRVDRP